MEDMKTFGAHLKHLNLHGNEISYLDINLFEFNPLLEFVSLSENPIKHVDPEFKENLRFLNIPHVELGGNNSSCINFYHNSSETQNLDWNEEKCKNDDESEDLLKTLCKAKGIYLVYRQFQKMKDDDSIQMENSRFEMSRLDKKILSLNEEHRRKENQLNAKITELNRKLESEAEERRKLEANLINQIKELRNLMR